ncbi:MAG: hypothetical protein EPO00_02885 [Chloroflexota bacterium]|nr:MAG: hypothetical protein EPO00_02885 [Chloroflexota bacterium]
MAYLLTVITGAAAFLAIQRLQQGGDIMSEPTGTGASRLASGLAWSVGAGLSMLPAFVSTIELVHRFAASSKATRSLLGAVSWAAWGLFGALTLAVVSGVTLVPDWLLADLILLGFAGAGFALLAFDGHEARAGRFLSTMALVVAALVVVASLWMAGRWGAAA